MYTRGGSSPLDRIENFEKNLAESRVLFEIIKLTAFLVLKMYCQNEIQSVTGFNVFKANVLGHKEGKSGFRYLKSIYFTRSRVNP